MQYFDGGKTCLKSRTLVTCNSFRKNVKLTEITAIAFLF